MTGYELIVIIGTLVAGILAIRVLRTLADLRNTADHIVQTLTAIKGPFPGSNNHNGKPCYTDWTEALKFDKEICEGQIRKVEKSIRFYEKLENTFPREEVWKLKRGVVLPMGFGLVPDEHHLPSELLKRVTLKILKQIHEEGRWQ